MPSKANSAKKASTSRKKSRPKKGTPHGLDDIEIIPGDDTRILDKSKKVQSMSVKYFPDR